MRDFKVANFILKRKTLSHALQSSFVNASSRDRFLRNLGRSCASTGAKRSLKSDVSKRALAFRPKLSGFRARCHRRIVVGVVESGVLAGMPTREGSGRGVRRVVTIPGTLGRFYRGAYSRHS